MQNVGYIFRPAENREKAPAPCRRFGLDAISFSPVGTLGPPAASCQTPEYSVLGSSQVEVERLRIEFSSKALDTLFVDAQAARAKALSYFKVLKISFEHFTITLERGM